MNPLHTPQFVAEMVLNSGLYFDATRRTGRSTAKALRLLSVAIENPNKSVSIIDHFDTPSAHRELLHTMRAMCERLGLEHMQFNTAALTVTFKRI